MSFAGAVIACWLAIATIAFLALSALARAASRQDTEADLGIVGNAELRMLLGEHDGDLLPLEARLGAPDARRSGGPRHAFPMYPAASRMLDGTRDHERSLERIGAGYTR